MATIAELSRKNDQVCEKARAIANAKIEKIKASESKQISKEQAANNAKIDKLWETDLKRIRRILEQTNYVEQHYSDQQWRKAIDAMIESAAAKSSTNNALDQQA